MFGRIKKKNFPRAQINEIFKNQPQLAFRSSKISVLYIYLKSTTKYSCQNETFIQPNIPQGQLKKEWGNLFTIVLQMSLCSQLLRLILYSMLLPFPIGCSRAGVPRCRPSGPFLKDGAKGRDLSFLKRDTAQKRPSIYPIGLYIKLENEQVVIRPPSITLSYRV